VCSVFAAVANAQQNPTYALIANPQSPPTNADGSISANVALPGAQVNGDYTGDCTKKFTIDPNPVLVAQGSTVTVTFNVGALGGPAVADAGSLVPQSAPTNTAFNIHSGGFVQWTLDGPKDPFATGTKPGTPYSRVTSEVPVGQFQTKTSPIYATAGCQILTATMQGDFKHNAQAAGYTGSYRCAIQKSVSVNVALPGTTINCTKDLVATFYFTPKGGEDLSAVVKTIYGKQAMPSQLKKLREAMLVTNKDAIHDPHKLPANIRLIAPDPISVK
jgi:hypothetical protein